MEDYKSNSHKSKEEANVPAERKKVEPVVKGKTVKKSNNVRKFTDVFVSEDVSNVKDYVLMDVLVPAVKKAISDIVTNGIEMILYGETSGKKSSSTSNVSYRSYYDDRRDDRRSSYRSGTGYNYDDIKFESRIDAEEVLNRMDELIDRYGVVTVADMYDLARMSCNYTDNKYGWTSLRTAEINRVRDGYIIKLPRAVPIE